jgi:hypothetical protein
MAGLVPAIRVLFLQPKDRWMPGTKASEATPFFERLWPGMARDMSRRLAYTRIGIKT